MIELSDTIAWMNSPDYRERFKAEYWQTKIRYAKLRKMLIRYRAGELDYEPAGDIYTLDEQLRNMSMYLTVMEIRALQEDIDLSDLDMEKAAAYAQVAEIQKIADETVAKIINEIEDVEWYSLSKNGKMVAGAKEETAWYRASDILSITKKYSGGEKDGN